MNICIHLLELKAMSPCACIADIRKFTSIKNGKTPDPLPGPGSSYVFKMLSQRMNKRFWLLGFTENQMTIIQTIGRIVVRKIVRSC